MEHDHRFRLGLCHRQSSPHYKNTATSNTEEAIGPPNSRCLAVANPFTATSWKGVLYTWASRPQGILGSALPPIASLAAVCLRIDSYIFVHHLLTCCQRCRPLPRHGQVLEHPTCLQSSPRLGVIICCVLCAWPEGIRKPVRLAFLSRHLREKNP